MPRQVAFVSSLPLLLLTACFSPAGTGAGTASDGGTGEARPGLQYSGAIATPGHAQISAPILPNMIVWQYAGGAGYPASIADAIQLVLQSTYTYDYLLAACAPDWPGIALSADPAALTAAQLEANYDAVSRCAYETYGSKPYWMPKILDDVDVCRLKLGASWRLIAEEDLDSFTEADFQLFQDTMTVGEGADWFPRQFYFSLDVYVRGRDGTLKWGDMTPGAQHVQALPVAADQMKDLFLGDGRPIGVRCIAAP